MNGIYAEKKSCFDFFFVEANNNSHEKNTSKLSSHFFDYNVSSIYKFFQAIKNNIANTELSTDPDHILCRQKVRATFVPYSSLRWKSVIADF